MIFAIIFYVLNYIFETSIYFLISISSRNYLAFNFSSLLLPSFNKSNYLIILIIFFRVIIFGSVIIFFF